MRHLRLVGPVPRQHSVPEMQRTHGGDMMAELTLEGRWPGAPKWLGCWRGVGALFWSGRCWHLSSIFCDCACHAEEGAT